MKKTARGEVFFTVDMEREYQDGKKCHSQQKDAEASVAAWLIYMEQHLARAKLAVYGLNEEEALHEVRKVTALGVACMEYRGAPRRIR